MKKDLWIIIGASSPIAKAFSHIVAKQGCDLILVGRDEADLQANASDLTIRYDIRCEGYSLDITHVAQHAVFVNHCLEQQKTIHVLFASGYMPNEAELTNDMIQQIVMTNMLAPMLLLHDIIKHSQSVVVLGSVAGDRGRAINAIYGSSKAGLATYIQGLQQHYPTKNIVLVKPGFIDTRLTYGKSPKFLTASPDACAKACWVALKHHRKLIYVSKWWRIIMWIIKIMPSRLFVRLRF